MRSQTKILGIYLFIYLSFDTAKGGGVGLHNVNIYTFTHIKTGIYLKKKKIYMKRQGICM